MAGLFFLKGTIEIMSIYICSECEHQEPKYKGMCPECEEWDTLKEVEDAPLTSRSAWKHKAWNVDVGGKPRAITDISANETERIPTGISELDRVLGYTGDISGMVPGEVVLLTAAPGGGKSTLMLSAADSVARTQGKVLYASGEESVQQIKMRSDRLGIGHKHLFLAPETDIETIVKAVETIKPKMLVVDSIQTMTISTIESAPGTIAQVRGCAEALLNMAKTYQIPVFLIGHLTKDGIVAGPRLLEHAVDAVLYLEGSRNDSYRILRGEKNRFGSTFEIGIFEMTDKGLLEVPSPSEALLAGRNASGGGSIVIPVLDGIRPLLVEIQALTNSCYGTPRRSVNGTDKNRVDLVIAVLQKKANVPLSDCDVYINAVGGMKVIEPGADLGIAIAVASSIYNIPINPGVVAIGELGLAGEIRSVNGIDRRLIEAGRMGFEYAIVPASATLRPPKNTSIKMIKVNNIVEAVESSLGKRFQKT